MKVNIGRLLEMAQECERKASRIYRTFADRFSSDHEAFTFWDALSKDEMAHEQYIVQLSKDLTSEIRSMEPKHHQLYPVEHLLQFMKDNPADEIAAIRDAISYTDRIENYEVTSIVQIVSQEYIHDDRRNEFFQKQLAEHYCMAEEFIRKHR
jgi:rubrerythrin